MPKIDLYAQRFTIKATVTAEHIAAGVQRTCRLCPVALMLAPLVAPLVPVVWKDRIYLMDRTKAIRFRCYPFKPTQEFIRRFDNGLPVEPTSIRLCFRRME